MRNIFLFIRRYFNFLSFILLQGVALYFLFTYNKLHEAAFMRVANEGTGWFSTRYDNVELYFNLKQTNEALSKENEALRNQLQSNFIKVDTGSKLVKDTVAYDTLGHFRQYIWRAAKVANNSIGLQNNYITIRRGEKQGVHKDMGVISALGIVGTVVNTSDNYAVVMSLLHRQSRVSVMMKKTGDVGTVMWEGESPLYLTMINVPKSVPVAKGDSVVTSQLTYLFPKGVMVGTVAEIVNDKTSNFYSLRLKPATDFYKLEYVTVVENMTKDEQKKLEEATKKNQ